MSACVPCGRVYRQLRREMRAREFQRAAVAAFLPLPAISGRTRCRSPASSRSGSNNGSASCPAAAASAPRRSLGGAGIAKAAVAGTAIVAAGGALTGHLVHSIEGARSQAHHRAHVSRQVGQPASSCRSGDRLARSTRALRAHPRSDRAPTRPLAGARRHHRARVSATSPLRARCRDGQRFRSWWRHE